MNGFTNVTGWSQVSQSCCQICNTVTETYTESESESYSSTSISSSSSSSSPYSVFSSASSRLLQDLPAKYDYLILDLLWVPQFCEALEQGHDYTLSHIAGTKCNPQWSSSITAPLNVTIHGLWPSLFSGSFMSCCLASLPLVPSQLDKETYTLLQSLWPDVTISSSPLSDSADDSISFCASCFLNNHEWLKHGSCLSSVPILPQVYFNVGLTLAQSLLTQRTNISSFASGSTITKQSILDLFPNTVNVMCDPLDTKIPKGDSTFGVLSEIQVCYLPNANGTTSITAGYTSMNCPPPLANSTFSMPCPNNVYIR